MNWKKKKVYGEYKMEYCPFCDRLATNKNDQGIAVCHRHLESVVEEIKCTCGSWLEPRSSKFGRYFNCRNCGNVNNEKAMNIKEMLPTENKLEKPISEIKKEVPQSDFQRAAKRENTSTEKKRERKEITITSHDVEYF